MFLYIMKSRIISFLYVYNKLLKQHYWIVQLFPFGFNVPLLYISHFCVFMGLCWVIIFYCSKSVYQFLGQYYACLIIICHNASWCLIIKLTLYNFVIHKIKSVPLHQSWSDPFQSEYQEKENSAQENILQFLLLMSQHRYQTGFPILVLNC